MCENELWCPECGLKAGKRVLQRYMQLRGNLTLLMSLVSLFTLSLAGDNNVGHFMYEKWFILRGFSKGFNTTPRKNSWGASNISYFIFHFYDTNDFKFRRHSLIMNNI